MSDLVVVAFPTEEKAEEVRKKLLEMQQEYLIELGDAVIAVKQPNGHVKLNQLFHPTASGAAYGALWRPTQRPIPRPERPRPFGAAVLRPSDHSVRLASALPSPHSRWSSSTSL